MIRSKLLVLALAAMMLMGCGDALFYANFDNDAVGVPPPSEPPGPPYGDRIYIPSLGLLSPPDEPLFVVAPFANFSGNGALYRNYIVSPEFQHVSFIGREPLLSVDEYWFVWVGELIRAEAPSDWMPDLEVTFWLDKGLIARVLIEPRESGQKFSLVWHWAADGSGIEKIGTVLGKHIVVFHFDVDTRQFAFSILQVANAAGSAPPGGSWITTGMRPSLLDPLDEVGTTPAVKLDYLHAPTGWDDEPEPFEGYYIDSITITQSCPHQVPSGSGTVTQYTCPGADGFD